MKKFAFVVVCLIAVSCHHEKPVADFSYRVSPDFRVVYCENLSTNADKYQWTITFPDGRTEKVSTPNMTPMFRLHTDGVVAAGEYRLSLAASSKYGYSEKVETFTIDPGSQNAPDAYFTVSSSNGDRVPTTLTCTNNSTNATHYSWTLTRPNGSTTTSTMKNPSFSCTVAGNYTIKLTAYNSMNESDSYSKTIKLEQAPSYQSYTITWLRLEKIPMLCDDGSSWDTGLFGGSYPDIYFKIQNSSNTQTYFTSPVKEDVQQSDLPIAWYSVNTTLDIGTEYKIAFYDKDGALDPDDIMANCIWESNPTSGVSSMFWESYSGDIRFVVGLEWSGASVDLTKGVDDNQPVEGSKEPVRAR